MQDNDGAIRGTCLAVACGKKELGRIAWTLSMDTLCQEGGIIMELVLE